MGQDESTLALSSEHGGDTNSSSFTVGSHEEEPQKIVLCDTCDLKATYRCKIKCKELSDIYKYPDLTDYWFPQTRMIKENYIVAYVACDKCISENVKNVFTYKPEGWYESICMEDDYEDANM